MRIPCFLASLALVAFIGQSARPDDDDPEPPDSLRSLDGKWQQVTRIQGGMPSDENLIKNRTITFEKNKYTLRDSGEVAGELTFVIDRSKKPAHIDVTFVNNGGGDKGIIKLERGVLTVCFAGGDGSARPRKFESKDGTQNILATYKRAKN